MRPLTVTRLAGELLLGSRFAAARFTNRHADDIRHRCKPVACDVVTRAALYDLDAVEQHFASRKRRHRRVA